MYLRGNFLLTYGQILTMYAFLTCPLKSLKGYPKYLMDLVPLLLYILKHTSQVIKDLVYGGLRLGHMKLNFGMVIIG